MHVSTCGGTRTGPKGMCACECVWAHGLAPEARVHVSVRETTTTAPVCAGPASRQGLRDVAWHSRIGGSASSVAGVVVGDPRATEDSGVQS